MYEKRTKRNNGHKTEKQTVKNENYESENKLVIWRFDMIDRNGSFAFDLNRDDFYHKEVMEKMLEYSTMTWADIRKQTHDRGKSKHHFLDGENLSPEAKERIKKMKLEQYSDMIFSFALQNKLRIVGIREHEHFHVLWYDPNHEICPSKKK